jgi:hypothetical protein
MNQMFWLDGGNVQNSRLGIGQNEYDPSVEAIQEVSVLQNTYAAEFGGSASGAIVSTTKSGGNNFHGSAYEYFRNDVLDAAGYFAPLNAAGKKDKAPLRYNQPGGTLGGPVIRNRTHYFAAYDARRVTTGSTQILNVPTELQRLGDFSKTTDARGALIRIYDPATTRPSGNSAVRDPFPGNVIPPSRIDPIARQLVDYWPLPNKQPVNASGAQNFSANRSRNSPTDDLLARIDHAFSDDNRFYFRFIYGRQPFTWTSVYPKVVADPEQVVKAIRPVYYYLFSDTHSFSPNMIMDVRYSFSDRKNDVRSAGVGSDIVRTLGLSGVPVGAFPQINVANMAGIGLGRSVYNYPIRQHQIIDTLTLARGSHLIKLGGEARQTKLDIISRPSISGAFSFAVTGTGLPGNAQTGTGFASFLTGFGNNFSLADNDLLSRSMWYLGWFVQDDWKVTSNLTLNFGLRWETDTPMRDKNNRMNGFDPAAINPVSGTAGAVRFAGVNGWPELPYDGDWNNLGPRFGFAWRPRGTTAWVVRGGYGIFYEHPFDADVTSAAALGFQRSLDLTSPDSGVTPAFYLRDGIRGVEAKPTALDDSFGAVPVGKAATTNVSFFERNRRTGYAQHYNLGLQRQLPGSIVMDVSYVANLSRKMPIAGVTLNQVPPGAMGPGNAQARRPYPQFNGVNLILPAMGVTNYHSGVMRFEKRLSHGLSFLGSYTWSRNIGNLNENNGFGDNDIYQDAYNRRADKGPSTIDIIHRFMWSSVYDLPFGRSRRWVRQGFLSQVVGGWTLGSVFSTQSGGPLTVTVQTNTTNSFSAGSLRADVLGEASLPNPTAQRWFDTDAFAAPLPFTFGNSGRGLVRTDGRLNFDFSINKSFYPAEQVRLQFRAELFNAFNHPDFGAPNDVFGSPGFGTVTSTTAARVVQLGLRLSF